MATLKILDGTPRRIFAVGDIHGCPVELNCLLEYLKGTAGLEFDDALVFIGDYVDRGPDSRAVIELLIEHKQNFPQTFFLKGNHEDMLLSYLGLPGRMGPAYLVNGGAVTLASYGIVKNMPTEELKALIPETHLQFYQNLDDYLQINDRIFVHAGLSPHVALDAQLEDDLFWIRDEFIMNLHSFEKTVIFGHTPYHDVMFHIPYKIGIDTGLVYDNKLTCVELVHEHVFQVKRGTTEVQVSTFMERLR